MMNLALKAVDLPVIRPVRDTDRQDLFGLIAICYADYPGCFVDPHDDLPDLRMPSTSYERTGGAFWAVEDERGRVCACVAVDFPEAGTAELHRLYVRPDQRGKALGSRLAPRASGRGARARKRRVAHRPVVRHPLPHGTPALPASGLCAAGQPAARRHLAIG